MENLTIDFTEPWLQHLCPLNLPSPISFNENIIIPTLLNALKKAPIYNHLGLEITFTQGNAAPANTAYETYIWQTGQVPTRNNLHDFFNACIWLTFSKTKVLLNNIQQQQIHINGGVSPRGAIRDAITLFDEDGIVLVTSNKQLHDFHQQHLWKHLLFQHRLNWQNPCKPNESDNIKMASFIFGHALLEKLQTPRKNLCGHCYTLFVDDHWFKQPIQMQLSSIDDMLCQTWQQQEINKSQFLPLPILGVPYFCEANSSLNFYLDDGVFRPKRQK